MKKIILFLIAIFTMIFSNNLRAETSNNKNILIVYYSNSGNTEKIANAIHERVDGDIFKIELSKPYPDDYRKLTEQAKKELQDGILPELKNKVENIGKYDIIFIGSPNWWGTISLPVRSFLNQHDLSDKKVVPFITNGGGGEQNTIKDLAILCKKCDIEEDAFISFRGNKSGFDKWINDITKKLINTSK